MKVEHKTVTRLKSESMRCVTPERNVRMPTVLAPLKEVKWASAPLLTRTQWAPRQLMPSTLYADSSETTTLGSALQQHQNKFDFYRCSVRFLISSYKTLNSAMEKLPYLPAGDEELLKELRREKSNLYSLIQQKYKNHAHCFEECSGCVHDEPAQMAHDCCMKDFTIEKHDKVAQVWEQKSIRAESRDSLPLTCERKRKTSLKRIPRVFTDPSYQKTLLRKAKENKIVFCHATRKGEFMWDVIADTADMQKKWAEKHKLKFVKKYSDWTKAKLFIDKQDNKTIWRQCLGYIEDILKEKNLL